jgi:hypothetical protein
MEKVPPHILKLLQKQNEIRTTASLSPDRFHVI